MIVLEREATDRRSWHILMEAIAQSDAIQRLVRAARLLSETSAEYLQISVAE